MYRLLLLLAVAVSSPAWACATCMCGDPTLTLAGVEKPFAGRQRASLDFLMREETQGDPATSAQTFEDQRYSLGYAYSPNARWTFTAQLPYVRKRLSRTNLAETRAEGIGDLDLSARWVLQTSREIPLKDLYGVSFGARVPTGQESTDQNGTATDVDALPGQGVFAPNIGAWYSRFGFPWLLYASANLQVAANEGYQGYKPAEAVVGVAFAQYAVLPELAVQMGLDYRYTGKNTFSNVADEDSGGFLGTLAPRVIWSFWPDIALNAGAQFPVVEIYNGTQSNEPTYSVGLTYDFGSED